MKKFAFLLFSAATVLFCGCSTSPKEGYSIVDGVIVFDVPARAEGQHSVLRLTVDPIPVVRVGFIGLGMRGPGAVERFANIDGDRKSTRLNSSHCMRSRMPSSA